MNFDLSDDQRMLKDTARSFLEREVPSAKLRALLDDPRGYTDELWSKITELGWPGLAVPEAYGGVGLGFLDLAVVLEEAGRALLPGPFFSAAVLAGLTLADAGSEAQKTRWLPEIAAGKALGALAVWEDGGAWTPQAIATKARKGKGGYAISGRKCAVLDAHVADFLLVAAKLGGGVVLLLVERGAKGVTIEPMTTVDGTRRLATVTLTGVKVGEDAVVGDATDGWPAISRALDRAAAGLAAEMVGGAGKALEMSVEYAKIRVQFGRPIGSFQAVSHRLADVLVAIEIGRSLCYAACLRLDEGHADAQVFASAAKAWMSETAVDAAEAALQLHGGIGYTWELDVHLHLRRARANAVTLGDAAWHRERIAEHVAARYRT